LLEEAEDDLLAFYSFPAEHWPKLRSTNPRERVNRELGRRTDVVGIFPNNRSLIRLAASVVIEQNDECWSGAATSQRTRWRRSSNKTRPARQGATRQDTAYEGKRHTVATERRGRPVKRHSAGYSR